MQRVRVLDSSRSDYLHDDEIVELEHIAAGKRYRLLIKNLSDDGEAESMAGLYIPASLIANMIIEGDHCVLVLSESKDGATASGRKAKIAKMVRNYRDAE